MDFYFRRALFLIGVDPLGSQNNGTPALKIGGHSRVSYISGVINHAPTKRNLKVAATRKPEGLPYENVR